MSDENTLVRISGGTIGINERGSTSILSHPKSRGTSSLEVEGSVNARRLTERDRYNRWLLGSASREELGHEQIPGFSVNSTPPSWVQTHTGRNQAFVISETTSSYKEKLNVYLSGTEQLESTAVPASSSVYYSKSQIVTTTYKLTGSALLGTFLPASGTEIVLAATENPVMGTTDMWSAILDVPDYGRIVDIRIWLEFVSHYTDGNLSHIYVGISPPNLSHYHAWPYVNDSRLIDKAVPQLRYSQWENFTLWNGMNNNLSVNNVWSTDLNMRTIFHDSAHQNNPANLDILFAETGKYLINDHKLGSGSPSDVLTGVPYATGTIASWTSEHVTDNYATAAGSPPQGWLTGPGGTNDDNEWPTTGSNYGPELIRPALPLLDDLIGIQGIASPTLESVYGVSGTFIGTRPGLRGREIHGGWTLWFWSTGNEPGYSAGMPVGWFRQLRLEISYEKNYDVELSPSRRKRVGKAITKQGGLYRAVVLTSSNGGADYDPSRYIDSGSYSYMKQGTDPGTTIGITSDTGSFPDWAVLSRITGTLSDRLTGSGTWWFLQNEFGTPYIPISSGSGVDPSFDISRDIRDNINIITDATSPKPLVSRAITLRSVIANKGLTRLTRDIVATKLTGSS